MDHNYQRNTIKSMAMKISWGTRIAILYITFVVLMVTLVSASMRQKFELVADDYYQQEVQFQQVIDASANRAALQEPVAIRTGKDSIGFVFPAGFRGTELKADILFYAAANSAWDRKWSLATADHHLSVPREGLHPTVYQVKISWQAEGKQYYEQHTINLGRL
jgi:hypothetical protein